MVDSDGNYLGVFSEKCSMNALTRPVEIAAEVGIDPTARPETFDPGLFLRLAAQLGSGGDDPES